MAAFSTPRHKSQSLKLYCSVKIFVTGARINTMKPSNDERPHLRAPAGTCDTHMHIYERAYPKAPTAKIDAPDAPVSEYLKVRKRLGIERTVVVQPSTYGTETRYTLATR